MTNVLLMVALTAYIGSSPDETLTYMDSLLNDESAPDGRSYSLYRVLTLTALTSELDEVTPE